MSLLIGFDPAGLQPATVGALDDIIAPLQTWVGTTEGLNQQLKSDIVGVAAKVVPVGALFMWPTATAPSGYVLCNGAAVSRADYASLFTVIGVTFGTGNGSTTFNVPDMRQRFPLGVATSGTGSTLAGTGGSIDHTHTGPSHTHTISGSTAAEAAHTHGAGNVTTTAGTSHTHSFSGTAASGGPSATVNSGLASDTPVGTFDHTHTTTISGTTGAEDAHTHGVPIYTTGTGSSHSHGAGTLSADAAGTGATGTANPPFLAVNYIIKT